jgi:hypothetical protein
MKYAAAIIAILVLFAGGFFTGDYFKKVPNIQPPQTILKDTIIYKDKIVYRDRPIPTPVILPGIPTPIYYYSDTLKTDSLDIVINDSIHGQLLSREVINRPIVFQKIKTEIQYIEKPIYKPVNLSIYGDVKTGGGPAGFVGAIELGIINKNRNKIGISVFKSEKTYFCISYGYVFPIN